MSIPLLVAEWCLTAWNKRGTVDERDKSFSKKN